MEIHILKVITANIVQFLVLMMLVNLCVLCRTISLNVRLMM